MLHLKMTTAIAAALALSACSATTGGMSTGFSAGGTQEREAGTTSGSAGGALGIGINQFIQMTEAATNDLVFSNAFDTRIANYDSPPRVVIGNVLNNTNNENIVADDLVQKMREILVSTGAVRVFTQDADEFDFVIAPTISSSTLQTLSSNEVERTYTFSFQVTTAEGEYITEQSVDRVFVEPRY